MYTNALKEQFLQGNVPFKYLLIEGTLFISGWRSAINEVNDWTPNKFKFVKQFKNILNFFTVVLAINCLRYSEKDQIFAKISCL